MLSSNLNLILLLVVSTLNGITGLDDARRIPSNLQLCFHVYIWTSHELLLALLASLSPGSSLAPE
jgi:hypothetical protein